MVRIKLFDWSLTFDEWTFGAIIDVPETLILEELTVNLIGDLFEDKVSPVITAPLFGTTGTMAAYFDVAGEVYVGRTNDDNEDVVVLIICC